VLEAVLTLLSFELLGDLLRSAMHLPVPGPVVGMLLLAICLAWQNRRLSAPAPSPLDRTAGALLEYMGLLFVPAGVGIIGEGKLLRQEWLPIMAAIIGSTVISLLVTGLVMDRLLRKPAARAVVALSGPPGTLP
jgi:holin-like protein